MLADRAQAGLVPAVRGQGLRLLVRHWTKTDSTNPKQAERRLVVPLVREPLAQVRLVQVRLVQACPALVSLQGVLLNRLFWSYDFFVSA